jgi:hypothetical protein
MPEESSTVTVSPSAIETTRLVNVCLPSTVNGSDGGFVSGRLEQPTPRVRAVTTNRVTVRETANLHLEPKNNCLASRGGELRWAGGAVARPILKAAGEFVVVHWR